MRATRMSNFSEDQAAFMRAGDQTVGEWNAIQAIRYAAHVEEEAVELVDALAEKNYVKAVDGAVDCIVVCIGFLHSLGVDPNAAWAAVHRANMRKVVDGKVCRREDGQIGKPPGWYGPEEELAELVKAAKSEYRP
jgi:predicted HAD superfamily Cof-like phosphohydrolase